MLAYANVASATFYTQLFDIQSITNKTTFEIPSSKTKKAFFIVIPAGLAGGTMHESSPIGIPTPRLKGRTRVKSKE